MNFSIIKSSATELSGIISGSKGKETTRLQLFENCPSALIAIREVEQGTKPSYNCFKWIPLKVQINGQERVVLLNIASACKRLLIAIGDLCSIIRRGLFEEFINLRETLIKDRDRVLKFVKYDMSDANELINKIHEIEQNHGEKFVKTTTKDRERIIFYMGGDAFIEQNPIQEGAFKKAIKVGNLSDGTYRVALCTGISSYDTETRNHQQKAYAQEVRCAKTLRGNPLSICPKTFFMASNKNQQIIIQDLFSSDLAPVLERLPADKSKKDSIARQLLTALRELHHYGIVHRDIKPENILVKTNSENEYEAVLCDFGLSTQIMDTGDGKVFGTLRYIPPEALRHIDRQQGTAGDVWAMGLILLYLYWPEIDQIRFQRVCEISDPNKSLDDLRQFIQSIPNNPWIRQPLNNNSLDYLLYRMLDPNPRTRMTAARALEKLNQILPPL